eukprot:gene22432-29544_t
MAVTTDVSARGRSRTFIPSISQTLANATDLAKEDARSPGAAGAVAVDMDM